MISGRSVSSSSRTAAQLRVWPGRENSASNLHRAGVAERQDKFTRLAGRGGWRSFLGD
jgi:hypothetical protein